MDMLSLLVFLQLAYPASGVLVAVWGGLLGDFIYLALIHQRAELQMKLYNIAEITW